MLICDAPETTRSAGAALPPTSRRTGSDIGCLSKAMQVLRVMGAARGWIGVRELARRSGFKPSCTHAILRSLLGGGFVAYDAARRQYRLGGAILLLAESVDPAEAYGPMVGTRMRRLSDELGVTVSALAWSGSRVQVVERVVAETEGRQPSEPHRSAGGLVLQAWRPEVRAYIGASGTAVLRTRLDEVRIQGWCCQGQAIAVPVMDASGACVLALEASLPSDRVDAVRLRRIRERLADAASAVGGELGLAG